MASSLRTKLRIAATVLGAPGFFDAIAGRFLWQRVARTEPIPPSPQRWQPLRGALHVHTCTYSDGAGTVEEVMAAAQTAGLDFVLLTDHNTMRPKADGWEERYRDQTPFLIVGDELTVEGGAFLLALDLPGAFSFPTQQPPQAAIDAVLAAGGLPLVSLPFDMKHPWEAWETTGCAGLEVLNLSTVARLHINPLSLLWLLPLWQRKGELAVLEAICTRPDGPLRRWDQLLAAGGRVIGVGALDAHALMKIGRRKYPLPSYENSFRAATTTVLVDPALPDRRTAVHEAIRAGRCYFSYDSVAPPVPVRFGTTAGDTMGESVMLGATLVADGGERALLRLYHHGKVVAAGESRLVVTPTEPGAYRLEIYRFSGRLGTFYWGVRPWIFTNPVYIQVP